MKCILEVLSSCKDNILLARKLALNEKEQSYSIIVSLPSCIQCDVLSLMSTLLLKTLTMILWPA